MIMVLTALHSAAGTRGRLAVVELLLSKGADINAKPSDGLSALHFAAQNQKFSRIF
jgi:ankyrin repeat protein